MPNLAGWVQSALKAFRFPASGSSLWQTGQGWGSWQNPLYYPGTNRDYRQLAGDLTESSAVMTCIRWIVRVWPEAPLRVYRETEEDKLEVMRDHPLELLIHDPNPHYDASTLWMGALLSWFLDGNAYWWINSNAVGQPAELVYLPHHLVEPRWEPNGREFISYYEYNPDGQPIRLPVEEVMHFRDGQDPWNQRKGQSYLKSVLREVWTDNEGANFSASLLGNMGIPGVLISPDPTTMDKGGRISFNRDDAENIKVDWMRKTQGDERGKPITHSIPLKVQTFAFSPEQMVTRDLRRIPEERISALIGIPAVVVGLGAGLDRSTYNNVSEAREQAYENCIIPTQHVFASQLTKKLLPMFGTVDRSLRCQFDIKNVRVLQKDENELMQQVTVGYEKGVLTRARALEKLGYETKPEDEVYFTDPVREEQQRQESMEQQAEQRQAQLQAMRERPALPAATVREEVAVRSVDPFLLKEFEPSGDLALKAALSLDEALSRFRKRMLRGEKAAVRDITDAYTAAEKRILGKLEALNQRIAAAAEEGQTITPAWIEQQRRYFELLEQIENEFTRLGAEGEGRIAAAQSQMVSLAEVDAQQLATRAAGVAPPGVEITWNRLPTQAVENLVGYAGDGSPLRELFEAIGPRASQAVREVLASGIAAGENPREIARGVKAALGVPKARAENIARTEVLRAYRETARQSYQANRDLVTGWVWHAALSGETCPGCWAMHGTRHSVDAKLDDHPQGRCVAVPITRSWAEITGDDTIPDTRPQVVPGVEVFAGLPESEQKRIVGPEAFRLMQQGRIRLQDMVHQSSDPRWGTMRRASSLQEAQAQAAQGVGS